MSKGSNASKKVGNHWYRISISHLQVSVAEVTVLITSLVVARTGQEDVVLYV